MNVDVDLVEFPETRVAAVEYRGPERQSRIATEKLISWRRSVGLGPDHGMTLGVHYSDVRTNPTWNYRLDVCVSYLDDIEPNSQGVVAKLINGGPCARLRRKGTRNYIPEADFLFRDWLPRSGHRLRQELMIFHYVNVGPDIAEDAMITDIYLPILG